jgi:TetR/AcrR family transcriptional repressor of nem operon
MSKRKSKKEHILRAGLEVMKIHGYNGTSVKDIVDAAVVPKGSFYNYFPSKESFAVEALQAVADESLSASRDLLASGAGSPLQRLRSYFEQNASQACEDDFKVGCFFGNMCQEMSDSNEIIRGKVRQILVRNTELFEQVLDEAKAAGEIAAGADTGMIAEFVMNAWEGTLMRMKASKSREPLDAFLGMLPQLTR